MTAPLPQTGGLNLGAIDNSQIAALVDLELRNPLGLLSEDIGPVTGALGGNFPQTYSLVGIINSTLRLSRTWDVVV